ncbi:hypothetical protein Mapa_018560 [Marchantia paleacea]|nr:hypothetical protein Mapa_018560 [Marchantia paleacea]
MLSFSKGISDLHLDGNNSEDYSFCLKKAFTSSSKLKTLRKGPFIRQQQFPVTEADLDGVEVRSSKEDKCVQQRGNVGSSVPNMKVSKRFGSVLESGVHEPEPLYRQLMCMESREISVHTALQDKTAKSELITAKQGHPEEEHLEALAAPDEQEKHMPANLMKDVMDTSPQIESFKTRITPSVTKKSKKKGAMKSVQLDEPKKCAGRKKRQSKPVKPNYQLGYNEETPATEAAGNGKRRRVNPTRKKKFEIVKNDQSSQLKSGRQQLIILPEVF